METEWVFCPGCGDPVIRHDRFVTDAEVGGCLGNEQTDTGIEHECRGA